MPKLDILCCQVKPSETLLEMSQFTEFLDKGSNRQLSPHKQIAHAIVKAISYPLHPAARPFSLDTAFVIRHREIKLVPI